MGGGDGGGQRCVNRQQIDRWKVPGRVSARCAGLVEESNEV